MLLLLNTAGPGSKDQNNKVKIDTIYAGKKGNQDNNCLRIDWAKWAYCRFKFQGKKFNKLNKTKQNKKHLCVLNEGFFSFFQLICHLKKGVQCNMELNMPKKKSPDDAHTLPQLFDSRKIVRSHLQTHILIICQFNWSVAHPVHIYNAERNWGNAYIINTNYFMKVKYDDY